MVVRNLGYYTYGGRGLQKVKNRCRYRFEEFRRDAAVEYIIRLVSERFKFYENNFLFSQW